MISYLKGKIITAKDGFIILDVSGIGYKVFLANSNDIKMGEAKDFFIYEQIREDCNNLYGFNTFSELELFEKLISVNGVGPKAGMAMMAASEPDKIISAIISENLSFFQSIPGIGKKAAAKIILDLKPKISGLAGEGVLGRGSESDDLIDALATLGYKKQEISKITRKIPADLSGIEDQVRWCLKNITKQ